AQPRRRAVPLSRGASGHRADAVAAGPIVPGAELAARVRGLAEREVAVGLARGTRALAEVVGAKLDRDRRLRAGCTAAGGGRRGGAPVAPVDVADVAALVVAVEDRGRVGGAEAAALGRERLGSQHRR